MARRSQHVSAVRIAEVVGITRRGVLKRASVEEWPYVLDSGASKARLYPLDCLPVPYQQCFKLGVPLSELPRDTLESAPRIAARSLSARQKELAALLKRRRGILKRLGELANLD